MISLRTTIKLDEQIIPDAIDAAADDCLFRGADRLAAKARASIHHSRQLLISELPTKVQSQYKKSHKPLPGVPSKPGQPPNSPTGILPKSIVAATSDHVALAGPAKLSKGGYPGGSALEFGRTISIFGREIKIEPRPFMAPALMAVLPTLANDFKDSVKG